MSKSEDMYMSDYEKNEAKKLAEMKFSPSYDMSKVITESGQPFLELESIYHYYDFNTGFQKDNLRPFRFRYEPQVDLLYTYCRY